MSVYDEGDSTAAEGSFWDIGNYKHSVKRIDNGYKLCDSLRQLIESRSEIERAYAKQLTDWSRKWSKFLETGPEYATLKTAWQGVIQESNDVSIIHTDVAEQLMNQVHTRIKQWQKENYHKSMMHFKESKDMDDQFRKAQKLYLKNHTKVMATKKEYHGACQREKTTVLQENNAKNDPSISPDQIKKLQDKLDKCQKDVETTHKIYEANLNDINSCIPKYIEDMNDIFAKCQENEKKRLEFFKDALSGIHKYLDLSSNEKYHNVYTTLLNTIQSSNADDDLRWWSNRHGAGMKMNWPQFEEFRPDLNPSLSRKGKSDFGSDAVTITSIKQSNDSGYASSSSETQHLQTQTSNASQNSINSNSHTTNSTSAPVIAAQVPPPSKPPRVPVVIRQESYDPALNPFADDDDDTEDEDTDDNDNDDKSSNSQSLNPFGDEDEGEEVALKEEEEMSVNSSKQKEKSENKIIWNEEDEPFHDAEDDVEDGSKQLNLEHAQSTANATTPAMKCDPSNSEPTPPPRPPKPNFDPPASNPFGEGEDWEEEDEDRLVDDGRPGVPVRAVFDYDAAEKDELTFKAGDIFTKLEEEDEQGWCKGRKDGVVGLYPASYIEAI